MKNEIISKLNTLYNFVIKSYKDEMEKKILLKYITDINVYIECLENRVNGSQLSEEEINFLITEYESMLNTLENLNSARQLTLESKKGIESELRIRYSILNKLEEQKEIL